MKKFIIFSFVGLSFQSILAATNDTANTFKPLGLLINSFTDNVVRTLTILFGAMAVTVFFYGIYIFIQNRISNPKESEKGKEFMIWSIVALFVMVSVWGIVRLGQSIIGIDKNANVQQLPSFCINGVNCDLQNKSSSSQSGPVSLDASNCSNGTVVNPMDHSKCITVAEYCKTYNLTTGDCASTTK